MKNSDPAHAATDKELAAQERRTRIGKIMKLSKIDFQSYSKRLLELDELYLKIQIVSGFTVEQIFEMFMAGYTMEPPVCAMTLSLKLDEKT